MRPLQLFGLYIVLSTIRTKVFRLATSLVTRLSGRLSEVVPVRHRAISAHKTLTTHKLEVYAVSLFIFQVLSAREFSLPLLPPSVLVDNEAIAWYLL